MDNSQPNKGCLTPIWNKYSHNLTNNLSSAQPNVLFRDQHQISRRCNSYTWFQRNAGIIVITICKRKRSHIIDSFVLCESLSFIELPSDLNPAWHHTSVSSDNNATDITHWQHERPCSVRSESISLVTPVRSEVLDGTRLINLRATFPINSSSNPCVLLSRCSLLAPTRWETIK
jgi:hypothetical protein